MASLSNLPTEIKEQIIRYAVDSGPEIAAICACLSRYWQALVERRTFRSLRLDSSHLNDLRRIVTPSRQAHVRRIDFSAVLPEYGCHEGDIEPETETTEEQHSNNRAFTDAVTRLFESLASWELQENQNDEVPRVELFLSAYSPNDFGIMPNGTRIEYLLMPKRWNSSVLDLVEGASEDLPYLPMIAAFEYRPRNERPRIRKNLAPSACCQIAAKLPNVQKLSWFLEDRDRGDSSAPRRQLRQDFATSLAELPESVRHFELGFENLGPANHAVQPATLVEHGTAPDALSEALRSFSMRLQTLDLNGCIVLDQDFLWPKECSSPSTRSHSNSPCWPRLERLSVQMANTSASGEWLYDHRPHLQQPCPPPPRSMSPDYRYQFRSHPVPELINRYFLAAAQAAAHMPRLRSLEMGWGDLIACVLSYHPLRGDPLAELLFYDAPNMYLTQELQDAWIAGAKSGQGRDLHIELDLDDDGESQFQCDCRPCQENHVGGWSHSSGLEWRHVR
ncbi:hypothetical protein VPNG_08515 [Cytospora leucostoma]|uniref:F-box domain-containing protein n=1 Tax=Cytospora leucostoma TaxID=1230097 RepID=A0A423W542_9PEZI|nr:hypothetical protein VPNG_08515 [Cytospora leucostoma]